MNDAIALTKRDTATIHDEIGEGVVRHHVHGLWVRGGVAKRLRTIEERHWWVPRGGVGYLGKERAAACITRSAEKPRQAKSFNSSRVIGPVVSCEPTVVIRGSQYSPGMTPVLPHARPTIFCARVYPSGEWSTAPTDRNTAHRGVAAQTRSRRLAPLVRSSSRS